MKGNFTLKNLDDAIWQFDTELRVFGPDLADLVNNKGKVISSATDVHLVKCS